MGDVVVLKKNYMFVEWIFCIKLFMCAAICASDHFTFIAGNVDSHSQSPIPAFAVRYL